MKEKNDLEAFTKKNSMCLKGVAIWIMMFHHCYRSVDRFENYMVDFTPFTLEFIVNLSDYFKICVSIFVFITGYGLYISMKERVNARITTEKWIYERLIKTLSGFWFAYILIFIITQIYAGYPFSIYFGKGEVRGIIYALIDFLGLAHLFSTPTLVSTWWYMSAAIVYIVILPVFVKWKEKLGYTTLIMMIMIIPRLVGDGYPGGIGILSFLMPLILGMIFAEYDLFAKLQSVKITNNRIASEIIQFIVYTVLLVGSIIIWWRFPRDKVWEFHLGIAAIIAICYCWKYIIRIPVIKELLLFSGKHSMNIFLIHSFIRAIFFGDFIYSFRYFAVIVLVLFSISLGISIIVEWLKRCVKYDEFVQRMTRTVTNLIEKG